MSNKILKIVNTEKTHKMADNSVYVFLVPTSLNKNEIEKNVEKNFSVKVDNVRTLNMPRKVKHFRGSLGYLSKYKKAYVKLADGMKIDLSGDGVKK